MELLLIAGGVAVVSAVLGVISVRQVVKREIQTESFIGALTKLTRQSKFDRARKLAAVVEAAPIGILTRHALALRIDERALVSGETRYRDAPETVPFAERVRLALAPLAAEQRMDLARCRRVALAGLALSLVALVLGRGEMAPLLAALTGLTAAGLSLWRLAIIERSIARTLEWLPTIVLPGDGMHGGGDPR